MFGYTSGCQRCEHEMKWGPGRTTRPHSERCRARIMEELSKTETGRLRLGLAAERMDRSLAEHIEQHDERKARAQGESEDVPNVPAQSDPFQTFEPLRIDPVPLQGGESVEALPSLPSSTHEPISHEEPVCDTSMVPPQLTGSGNGMDVDMVVASEFDGRGPGRQIECVSGSRSDREGQHRKQIMEVAPVEEMDATGGVESRTETSAVPEAATAVKTDTLPKTPMAMPVRGDAHYSDDRAMGETMKDFERLSKCIPAVEAPDGTRRFSYRISSRCWMR